MAITALFCITGAMLTVNYNQVYGVPGYERIEFRFLSGDSFGDFGKMMEGPGFVCPDSNEVRFRGAILLDRGIASREGKSEGEWYRNEALPVSTSNIWLSGEVTRHQEDEFGNELGIPDELTLNVENWRIVGAPPNQEFVVEGIETEDAICNSRIPTDFTISGSCRPDSIATFASTNGQRAQLKIEQQRPETGPSYPICFVCPPAQVAIVGDDGGTSRGFSCVEEGLEMNATKSKDLTDSGTNPSDLDVSAGHVERDDRPPQPSADDDKQKAGVNSSEYTEDTSGSNDKQSDEPSINTKQTDMCPSNESIDPKSGECIPG